MNLPSKKIVLLLIMGAQCIHANLPYISIRSPSVDSARDIVGITDKINLYDMENLYITSAITLEGTRSFDSDALAHALFGFTTPSVTASDELTVTISGSQVPNRGATDWLADYFGLSTTYQSQLFFKPRVSNFIVDFEAYVGLDEWITGLYAWVQAPLVITRWNLNFREEVNNDLPLLGYPAGYFAPDAIPAADLVAEAQDFFSDQDVPTIAANLPFEPLEFARMEQARLHKTALSEIQMALGYNFVLTDCYFLGLNFRVYAPTGTRPRGKFVFEPVVGNGKHWEVGAGIMAGYLFWRSEDEESSFGFYLNGNFTHLCRATQTRTFDLIGKPNSRYMLAERLGTPVVNLFTNPVQGVITNITQPTAQFKTGNAPSFSYTPVANLTTIPVHVSSPIQVDITALFNYAACGLSVDVGYNFWARACEKISPRLDGGPLRLESGNVWALKGDANVFGFEAAPEDAAIPLSATQTGSKNQPGATIHAGTNNGNPQNPGVDNPEYAFYTDTSAADQIVILPGQAGGPTTQQRTSNDPVFLSLGDIDFKRGSSKGMSHKIFAHLSYTWTECDDIVPFLGVGGKAEFGPRHNGHPCIGASCQILRSLKLVAVDAKGASAPIFPSGVYGSRVEYFLADNRIFLRTNIIMISYSSWNFL